MIDKESARGIALEVIRETIPDVQEIDAAALGDGWRCWPLRTHGNAAASHVLVRGDATTARCPSGASDAVALQILAGSASSSPPDA